MKFLLGDPRTTQCLQHWSGGKRVLVAPFYFFYNGSDMQKSGLGLLSSLLYTLLKQERKLIPIGFKARFEAGLGGGQISTQKLSIFETRRALKEVILHSPDIFFFLAVDGLDEFDPRVSTTDVGSLLQLTRSLGNFHNAKLIASSRPLSAFEQEFVDCPSLAIHTLTREDIHSYVFEELQSHPRMKMLMSRDEEQAKTLIQSISDNSSDVFLWVRLVVRSLLEGLQNSDRLEELQARLEELPHDLHTLYSVMLSRIPPQYLPQTAKLIQIVETATCDKSEFSLLGLWYADQWTDLDLFREEVSPISEDEIKNRTVDMKGRLESRCLGLIKTYSTSMTYGKLLDWNNVPRRDVQDPCDTRLRLCVKFIHRTVSEFLGNKGIRARFVNIPSLSNFSRDLASLRSAIAVVKEFLPGKSTDWVVLLKLAGNAGFRLVPREKSISAIYRLKLLRPWHRHMHFISSSMVKFLIDNGSSPHEEFCGKTVWGLVPVHTKLLKAGANVNGRVWWEGVQYNVRGGKEHNPQSRTLCTLGLAVGRVHELVVEYLSTTDLDAGRTPEPNSLVVTKNRLESIAGLLETGGAVEQEWDIEGNLIPPVTTAQEPVPEASEGPEWSAKPPQQNLPPTVLGPDEMHPGVTDDSKANGLKLSPASKLLAHTS
ncbi:hypothetical protein PG994_004947 [Apiospora phragmitis]|uniref:NACHT domain-containing protein n=1 Tax=Apiospora phragmitis TaxID=2905665 RepID=A0ABR1VS41_9PEZI